MEKDILKPGIKVLDVLDVPETRHEVKQLFWMLGYGEKQVSWHR